MSTFAPTTTQAMLAETISSFVASRGGEIPASDLSVLFGEDERARAMHHASDVSVAQLCEMFPKLLKFVKANGSEVKGDQHVIRTAAHHRRRSNGSAGRRQSDVRQTAHPQRYAATLAVVGAHERPLCRFILRGVSFSSINACARALAHSDSTGGVCSRGLDCPFSHEVIKIRAVRLRMIKEESEAQTQRISSEMSGEESKHSDDDDAYVHD